MKSGTSLKKIKQKNQKTKTIVIDTFAVLSYFFGQKNQEEVADLLEKAENGVYRILLSDINFGEIYYMLIRKTGIGGWQLFERSFATLPIEIASVSHERVMAAAKIKSESKLSYADAFCAGLALENDCAVVTGDLEFKNVKNLKLRFLGN